MSNALAIIEPSDFAILRSPEVIEEMTEVIQENQAGGGLSIRNLTKITVPAGGGTAWQVPTAEGDKNMDSIEGIVIVQQPRRVYFSRPFGEGENNAPDCQSNDAVTGYGVRFPKDIQTGERQHNCLTCPLAKFGADRTPPPCSERRTLFILRPEDALPVYIDLPPTSLKPLNEYNNRLSAIPMRLSNVITSISLVRIPKEGNRPAYSTIVCKQVGTVTDRSQREALKNYRTAIEHLIAQPIIYDDGSAAAATSSSEDMEEIDI